jgi:hypothetical protein
MKRSHDGTGEEGAVCDALVDRPLSVRLPACSDHKVVLPPAPAGKYEVVFTVEFANASPDRSIELAMAVRIDGNVVSGNRQVIERGSYRPVQARVHVDLQQGAVVSLTWRPFSRRRERVPPWLTITHAEAHMRSVAEPPAPSAAPMPVECPPPSVPAAAATPAGRPAPGPAYRAVHDRPPSGRDHHAGWRPTQRRPHSEEQERPCDGRDNSQAREPPTRPVPRREPPPRMVRRDNDDDDDDDDDERSDDAKGNDRNRRVRNRAPHGVDPRTQRHTRAISDPRVRRRPAAVHDGAEGPVRRATDRDRPRSAKGERDRCGGDDDNDNDDDRGRHRRRPPPNGGNDRNDEGDGGSGRNGNNRREVGRTSHRHRRREVPSTKVRGRPSPSPPRAPRHQDGDGHHRKPGHLHRRTGATTAADAVAAALASANAARDLTETADDFCGIGGDDTEPADVASPTARPTRPRVLVPITAPPEMRRAYRRDR